MAVTRAVTPIDIETPFRRFLSAYLASKVAVFGLVLLTLVLFAAIAGPFLAPQNPYDLKVLDVMDSRLAPGGVSGDGKMTFLLGSDEQGRDMVSAILYGIRTSVLVGVVSTAIALVIGLSLGLWAAYLGGRFDGFVMRLVDIQLSFPPILIALILLALEQLLQLSQLGFQVDDALIFLTHAGAHVAARQIGPQHRHACAYRRHHDRAIGRPGPGLVVPVQQAAGLFFAGACGQAGGALAAVGHLQRQRRQLAAPGKCRHNDLLHALVRASVMLLAEQQHVSWQPGGQAFFFRLPGLQAATAQAQQQGDSPQQAGAVVRQGKVNHTAILRLWRRQTWPFFELLTSFCNV